MTSPLIIPLIVLLTLFVGSTVGVPSSSSDSLFDVNGSFLDLNDTPSTYVGQAGKVPFVNGDENGLYFSDANTVIQDVNGLTEADGNALYVKLDPTNNQTITQPASTFLEVNGDLVVNGNGDVNGEWDVNADSAGALDVHGSLGPALRVNTNVLRIQASNLRPFSDNFYEIGASTLRWSNNYFVNVDVNENANVGSLMVDRNATSNADINAYRLCIQDDCRTTWPTGTSTDLNWTALNTVVPWQDVNVDNDLTIDTSHDAVFDGSVTINNDLLTNDITPQTPSTYNFGNPFSPFATGYVDQIGYNFGPANLIYSDNIGTTSVPNLQFYGTNAHYDNNVSIDENLSVKQNIDTNNLIIGSAGALLTYGNNWGFCVNDGTNKCSQSGIYFNATNQAIDIYRTGTIYGSFHLGAAATSGSVFMRPRVNEFNCGPAYPATICESIIYSRTVSSLAPYSTYGYDINLFMTKDNGVEYPVGHLQDSLTVLGDYNGINAEMTVGDDINFTEAGVLTDRLQQNGVTTDFDILSYQDNGGQRFWGYDSNTATVRNNLDINGNGQIYTPNLRGEAIGPVLDVSIYGANKELVYAASTETRKYNIEDYNLFVDPDTGWCLRPRTYTNRDGTQRAYGFVAQEVAQCFPDAVVFDRNGNALGLDTGRLAVLIYAANQSDKQRKDEIILQQAAFLEQLQTDICGIAATLPVCSLNVPGTTINQPV